MKPVIIKLNLAGTVVHVNASQIIYYYPKQTENGKVVTVLYFSHNWGIEILDTPAEIDALIQG